tara:strand:- start:4390 stop:6339 length:1950 start_codon:yes stop_codon:yes gene_type:complete
MLSYLKKGISKLSSFGQDQTKSALPLSLNSYEEVSGLRDKNDILLIKRRLPGFIFGAFRNVAAGHYQIDKTLKSIKIELIAEYPEVLNFNHIAIWAKNDDGSLYKIERGFECSMSSVAEVLPDPSKAMLGSGANSVSVHSKREVKPWWKVDFNELHHVVFVEFYNRKDKWGGRAKSIIVTGFDEQGKKAFQGGRILKKDAQLTFYRTALPLLKHCDAYLKSQGLIEAAQKLEGKFVRFLTEKADSSDKMHELVALLQITYNLITSPTPDIPNEKSVALNITIPKGTKFFRVIGYRRKLVRTVKLNVAFDGVDSILEEATDLSYPVDHFTRREHLWTLQHPHIFNFSSLELTSGGIISLWCEDFYSGDAFVQRIIQISEDGQNWVTVQSTLDELEARLAIVSAQEWLLGESWDATFVEQLGHFLATYRMSQARTVKPLLRANRQLLPAFYAGVEKGGATAKFLPSVIYTRHGLTVPFEHIDSKFLANRMKRFVDFLDEKLDLQAFPCYGTLLGIHRDGDFLPHDDDIDLAVIVDLPDGVEYLEATLMWAEVLRGQGISCKPPTPTSLNLHCYFEDFDMDLFFIYRMPGQPKKVWTHMQGYQVREVTRSLLEPLTKLDFCGYQFHAPAKIESFLEDRYGKGWVTPDPTYEL